jgi:hypothetical protein
MVTMSSTRDWVMDILIIDAKKGDIRLRDGWEKIIRDRGDSDSTRHKGE